MKMTPLDIQQMAFSVKFRGYDRREIRQFLEELSVHVEMLTRENHDLRTKLGAADAALDERRKAEQTLSQALITAQAASEELKAHAQREAELIVKEAELKAAELLRQAQKDLADLQRELSDLQKHRLIGIERLRSTLRTFERLLEVEEQDVCSPRR